MSHKTLLVGLGRIGLGYDLGLDPEHWILTHARAFARHSAFDLVAAVDPHVTARQTFSATFGLPAYATIEEVGTIHDYSLAVIASPTELHDVHLKQVLRNPGLRAVLCEKPLANCVSRAQAMLEDCSIQGVQVFVNYMRRCEPGALKVAHRIESGEMMGPFKGVAWYTKGLRHNGSHFVNLLERWIGPVAGWSVIDRIKTFPDGDAQLDLKIRFARGEVTFLAACDEDYAYFSLDLLARNGRLRYDHSGASIEWTPRAAPSEGVGTHHLERTGQIIAADLDRYQWYVADSLARSLQGQDTELCTGAQALTTLQIINRMLNEDAAHV